MEENWNPHRSNGKAWHNARGVNDEQLQGQLSAAEQAAFDKIQEDQRKRLEDEAVAAYNQNNPTVPEGMSSKMKLIIGLSIGIPVLIIGGVLIYKNIK